MARRHGLIVVLAALIAAPPAQAAPAYSLFGAGALPLRPGILAAEADVRSMPLLVAAEPGGAVAFAADRTIYTLRGNRLVRVPAPADGLSALAFGPTGELLAGTCPELDAGRVYRVAADRSPTVIAGRAGASRTAGDGGPATAARLECVSALDVDAEAGLLIADAVAGRVRRIASDGTIRTVAGVARRARRESDPKPAGDGGAASAAVLALPTDVAALAGGGFAILDDGKIRLVGGDGVIRTIATVNAVAIAPRADGLLILEGAGRVWQRSPDGALTPVTDLGREAAGIAPSIPVANDPFGPDEIYADEIVAAPDGGVLFSADFAIHYVAPAEPRRLALAIRPATRVPAATLTVRVATTLPAQLRIGVWRNGRRAALVTTNVPGGEVGIPVPSIRTPGLYVLHIQAADHDQVAAATASVLIGRRLPIGVARGFIRSRFELFEAFDDGPHVSLACRRMADIRVDCAAREGRHCVSIVSMRAERDGTFSVWPYDGGRRCRFSRERGAPPARRPIGS